VERKFEAVNGTGGGFGAAVGGAFDCFMANLPILVCGIAVALAVFGDMLYG